MAESGGQPPRDDQSTEPQSTSDPVAFYAMTLASRLKRERFTAAELLALARQQGHSFLTEGLFRIWVHRKLFPEARERLQARGKPGIWYRADAVRLLDLCVLHTANSREQALQLGMWLLGYALVDVAAAVEVRDLLIEQLERIEKPLFGEVLTGGLESFADQEMDSIASSIERAMHAASHLDELCYGLPTTGIDLEEAQSLHPQIGAGASLSELSRFTLLQHAGDARLSPLPATAEAAFLPYLMAQAKAIDRAIKWKTDVTAVYHDPNIFPTGDHPESPLTAEQLTSLQRDLIGLYLWKFTGSAAPPGMSDQVFALPTLHAALQSATEEELQQARILAAPLLLRVFLDQRALPSQTLTALTRLGAENRWYPHRLFAAPAFFPLTAYLIAAIVYAVRHPRHIAIRRDLLPFALDQLARMARESVSRADAFLAVIMSVVPREEMSG